MLQPGGVVAYYRWFMRNSGFKEFPLKSVHFPSILVAGDAAASARVDAVWWKFMQQRLAGFWPRNQADGTELGPTNRRDYYVNTIPCPYTETRVDETIRYRGELVTV